MRAHPFPQTKLLAFPEEVKGAKFEGCVEVSYEAKGGSAVAVFARNFGEIVNSRSSGFNNRTIKIK